MEDLIIVKFGGSILTKKKQPFKVDWGNMLKISFSIHEYLILSPRKLIIVNGGGSFPHTPATVFGVGKDEQIGISSGAIQTKLAARELNNLIVQTFLQSGIAATPFESMSLLNYSEGKLTLNNPVPILALIERGYVPVTYGDVLTPRTGVLKIVS